MSHHIEYTTDSILPPGLHIGQRSRIVAGELHVYGVVNIGDDVTIAGDSVVLGGGSTIESGCDLRASHLVIGAQSEIGARCSILVADEFSVGHASRICADCKILCRQFIAGEFLYLADQCSVGYGGTKESTAVVTLGNRVALGPHNILNANCEIELENGVGSGSFVTFWTHGYHFGHSILDGYVPSFEKIHVRQNVWLGFHVTVLPGVEIGENSIVAACSVVAKAMPADKLIGGVPAKVLRDLKPTPLTAGPADDVVRMLIARWQESLEWKGVRIESTGNPDEFIAEIESSEIHERVVFLRCNTPAKSNDSVRTIWVSVEERPSLRQSLTAEQTLFECRVGRLSGKSTGLSEDLRDFLRRNTLPCGTETVLRALEPPAFARLRCL